MLQEILKELKAEDCARCGGSGTESYTASSICWKCDGLGKDYSKEQRDFIAAIFPFEFYRDKISGLQDRVSELESKLPNNY
jgi:hypothetical protein